MIKIISNDLGKLKLNQNSYEEYNKSTITLQTAITKQVNSVVWLKEYGLKFQNLDKKSVLRNIGFLVKEDYAPSLGKYVESVYSKNLFVRIKNDDTGEFYNITADKGQLEQYRLRLNQAIELYRNRLNWLTTGSRKYCGVLQERSAFLILDNKSQSLERFDSFLNIVETFLRDQVQKIHKFNIVSEPVEVRHESITKAIEWLHTIERLAPNNATSTAECLSSLASHQKDYEAFYLITDGESAFTSPEFLDKAVCHLKCPLNIISYACDNMDGIEFLYSLCKRTDGRFHSYSVDNYLPIYLPNCWDVESFYSSIRREKFDFGGPVHGWGQQQDCILLFDEMEEAKFIVERIDEVLKQIKQIPTCVLSSKSETSSDEFRKRQPAPICNGCDSGGKREEHMSSKEWLQVHGLKAQHLDIYDVLATVSFKHCDGVVEMLGPPSELLSTHEKNTRNEDIESIDNDIFNISDRSFETNCKQPWTPGAIVQPKLINAQYCRNFVHVRWKDGSLIHVQITPELYRLYAQRMKSRLTAIQNRLRWLRNGSRELFGTITEDEVCILVDTSTSMLPSLDFVKQKLLTLLSEQIKYKNRFNLVAFNSAVKPFRERLVSTTANNLKMASDWIDKLQCGGTTNTLNALQFALSDSLTQGIYLLTDGRPDQNPNTVLIHMHTNNRIPIHTVSFNCSDPEANQFLLELAQDSGGRFHYFSEILNNPDTPKSWESEDVRLLQDEYQYGLDSLEKLAQLRAECNRLRMKPIQICSTDETKKNISRNRKNKIRLRSTPTCTSAQNESHSESGQESHFVSSLSRLKSPEIRKQPELIRCSTILSTSALSCKSTNRKKKHIPEDPYYSLLQNLNTIRNKDEDFILLETKELLDYQDKRYEKAVKAEILEEQKKRNLRPQERPSSAELCTITSWLKFHGLRAQELRLIDLITPVAVRLRPTYVPALRRYVVSEVIRQTMPLAFIAKSKPSEPPVIRLANPRAVDFEAYEIKLRSTLSRIERKLIQIITQYLTKSHLKKLKQVLNLDMYTNWLSHVCWYQHKNFIIRQFEEAGWPFPSDEFNMLTNELDMGEKYLSQAIKLKIRWKTPIRKTCPTERAPCGHPLRQSIQKTLLNSTYRH